MAVSSWQAIPYRVIQGVFPIFALVALLIFFSVGQSAFLTPVNLGVISSQASVLLIVGCGITFIILMGSIDLSVGALVSLTVASTALILQDHGEIGLAVIPIAVVIGGVAGLTSGITYAYGRVPSFMATLGMLSILDGISLTLLGGGRSILIRNDSFLSITSGHIFPNVPTIALWAIVVWVVATVVCFKTQFGRYMYAIGGGESVARLSGVDVDRYKVYAFVLSGILAGLAGALLAARLSAGSPRVGADLLLNSIAAVVVGGTPLTGAVGGVHRTLLGVAIIAVLDNGLNIMQVETYHQLVIKGIVVVAAVLISLDRSRVLVMK